MKPKHKRINLLTCTKDDNITKRLIDKFNTSWIQIYETPNASDIPNVCAYNKFSHALIIIDESEYNSHIAELDKNMFYLVITDNRLSITDDTWNVCMIPKTIAHSEYLAEFVHLMLSRRTEIVASTAIKNNALRTLEEIKRI